MNFGDLSCYADIMTSIGCFLTAAGAMTQAHLQLSEPIAYMRRAGTLDKDGVKEAKPRKGFMLGYRNREALTWIPQSTHVWLENQSAHLSGWSIVFLGAFMAGVGSVGDLGVRGVWWFIAIAGGLVTAALIDSLITAERDRRGVERAEEDWRKANVGRVAPKGGRDDFIMKSLAGVWVIVQRPFSEVVIEVLGRQRRELLGAVKRLITLASIGAFLVVASRLTQRLHRLLGVLRV